MTTDLILEDRVMRLLEYIGAVSGVCVGIGNNRLVVFTSEEYPFDRRCMDFEGIPVEWHVWGQQVVPLG